MASVFQIAGAEWLFLFLGLCLIGIVALVFGALWMYRDAQSRRMDATVWVVLLVVATLLVTIIGFVIVFVIYLVVREEPSRRRRDADGLWAVRTLRTVSRRSRARGVSGVRPPDDLVSAVPTLVLSCLRRVPLRMLRGGGTRP